VDVAEGIGFEDRALLPTIEIPGHCPGFLVISTEFREEGGGGAMLEPRPPVETPTGGFNYVLSLLNIMTPWRRRRLSLGLSQAEVARLVGISRTALSQIETGRSVPSQATREALERALDPFWNPLRCVHPGRPLAAADAIHDISVSEGIPYALTLDVAAWILTRYQTPSTAWAYVRPLEQWAEAFMARGGARAHEEERANVVFIRAPEEVLRDAQEVEGFRLAPLAVIMEDCCRLGGRHALDAARLYMMFKEARMPGLRMDPGAIIKVWEEFAPWM
jgi:transcriptional regulator with XRE-family HTH domain